MPSNYYQAARCQHIKDSGTRCGSPALRGFDFCFYHRRANTPVLEPRNAEAFIPVLENGEAVGLAVTNILRALSADMIDSKKAYAMFYGIQLMGMAFKHRANPDQQDIEEELSPAMEAIVDTDYSKPGLALAVAREVNRPRPDRGIGISVREAMNIDQAAEQQNAFCPETSDACHPERGRMAESNDPEAVQPSSNADSHPADKHSISLDSADITESGPLSNHDAAAAFVIPSGARNLSTHDQPAPALLTTSQINRLATHLGLLDSYTREQIQDAWTRIITDHPGTAAKILAAYPDIAP